MSTLSSNSTLAEIRASYMDNASYAEDASTSKCKAFVTAVRLLLLLLPQRSTQTQRQSVEFGENLKSLQHEKDAAEEWLAANETTGAAAGRVVHPSFRNFRGR